LEKQDSYVRRNATLRRVRATIVAFEMYLSHIPIVLVALVT